MNQTAARFYQEEQRNCKDNLRSVTVKIRRFAWYRLASFLLIFSPLFAFGWQGWLTAAPMVLFLFVFLYLVKKNLRLEREKKRLEILKSITADELLALKHHFRQFDSGEEFADMTHFYATDLDIFGEDSLFQFINRTSTQSGRLKLAGWFQNPSLEEVDIKNRQQALKELSGIPRWRLHFLVQGHLFHETAAMSDEIKAWSHTSLVLNRAGGIKWVLRILPVLTLLSLIPAALGVSWSPFLALVIGQWIFLSFFRKQVTRYFRFFGRKSELLGKYKQLLEFIEAHEFRSSHLIHLQKKICCPEKASILMHQLKSLVDQFEYRQNLIVALILNSIFLWDLRCVYRLWLWHVRHREKLTGWLDTVAETDALISLANWTHNHPHYVFPGMADSGFVFEVKQLGHPLLHPDKRVCNDLSVSGWSKVLIITGANMAGKSTFLRTVGVNLVLARMGAPVCAESMTFSPLKVYTDMRTTDSLLKDESYFFAELKRIKGVLDRLHNGERIFVILDEMLKGTNSVDKLNGSRALIRKLADLKAVTLIATHDLKLSEMANEYPGQVVNKCFEIRIKDNEMVFDYLLIDGVTQTMNATFLMKKMGII